MRVPTTLNVGSLDLIHPDLVRLPAAGAEPSRRLMEAHQALGCLPAFTCALYQSLARPRLGDQVAWGESNAIVFANSVIRARTARYGDFVDLCCAITGRARAWSLHLDEHRLGRVVFRLSGFPASLVAGDELFVAVGLIVDVACGPHVPVIVGLPDPQGEDRLKALAAAAASSGSVAMFHNVGFTPEAPDFATALGGREPLANIEVMQADFRAALANLSSVPDGTPHFSSAEWRPLTAALAHAGPCRTPIYVNTARETLRQLEADPGFARLVARA